MDNGTTVCVTGAGGFIASWIVLKLLERGYKVNGTVRDPDDDKRYGHLKRFPGAQERLTVYKADILDYDSLVPAIRGSACVFHTAFYVLLGQLENPAEVLEPALEGTRNVMNACRNEDVKHVVFTSSGSAVVVDVESVQKKVLDESCWSDPEYSKKRKLWYAYAKRQGEELAWELAREYSLNLRVICPFVVFGPPLHPVVNTSIQIFIKLIDGSKEIPITKHYSMVDVRDVAEAHILAFESPGASGRYLCCERTVSCKNMIETLKKVYPGLSYPVKWIGDPGVEKDIQAPFTVSNQKVLGLVKKFTPYENTLFDTASVVHARGLVHRKGPVSKL